MAEARRHVEECATCQDYFDQDRMILDLYARLREREAPPAVRERVVAALEREEAARPPTGSGRRAERAVGVRRWGAAVFVVAAAATTVVSLYAGRESSSAEGAVFMEDYLRRAVGEERIASSDPVVVSDS